MTAYDFCGSARRCGTILPRLKSYVPAATILEIAPGYGRWTQFLRPFADRLVLVDLSARCIDACRRRFTGCSNIEYHVDDGASLAMIWAHWPPVYPAWR